MEILSPTKSQEKAAAARISWLNPGVEAVSQLFENFFLFAPHSFFI